MNIVRVAQAISTKAHTGVFRSVSRTSTTRPGSPPPPRSVRLGDQALAAGWLHDTIDENTWVMVGFRRTARFPETVITTVESVSRVPGEVVLRPSGLRRVDPIGRYVKLADNDENSADEPCTPAGYRRRVGTLR